MKGRDGRMQSFNIHPAGLIKALSMALELAVSGMSKHHWRTALICRHMALRLDIGQMEMQKLLHTALLHDIGAASSWDERRKLKDESLFVGKGVYKHAEDGYLLLKDSARLADLAKPIRHHHDKWGGGNLSGAKGEEIPLISRIIHLADRVEVLIQDQGSILSQRGRIIDKIVQAGGGDFDPDLVECFKRCAQAEYFWLDLVNGSYYDEFFADMDVYGVVNYSLEDIIGISEIFAMIIDRMSVFTANHSRSVAKVAAYIARDRGFSTAEVKYMQVAGLLHDLGKLSIPNSILEKPGALTSEEVAIIRQHTYYTYRILEKIDNFGVIKKWAAYHHECLDGSGYPFRLTEDEIPLGARIVAVADVFVALTEERPYRGRLPKERVEAIVLSMARKRKLDAGVAGGLLKNYDEAIRLMDT